MANRQPKKASKKKVPAKNKLAKGSSRKVKQLTKSLKQPQDESGNGTPLDQALYRVLNSRLIAGQHCQREWLQEGANRMKFIEGDQWNLEQDMATAMSISNGWMRRTVNKMKPLMTGIVANVAFQKPRVTASPLKRSPTWARIAETETSFLNVSIKECRFDKHQRLGCKDALVYGQGYWEEGRNPHKEGLPSMVHRKTEDVVLDPLADNHDSMGWVAIRQVMNVHTARNKYNVPDLPSDEPRVSELRDGNIGRKAKAKIDQSIPQEKEDEQVTLWRIYLKKETLDFATALTVDVDEKETSEKKVGRIQAMLEKEGNRVIVLAENQPQGHSGILANEPWPFILDKNEFPLTIVTLSDQARLYHASELKAVEQEQTTLNIAYSFLLTEAYTMAKIKFICDDETVSQDNVINRITSNKVGDVIGVNGGALAFKKLDMGDLNQGMIQMYSITEKNFDEISGFQEIFGGMGGVLSATQASIKEGRAQTLSSDMRMSFERGVDQCLRHLLQIAYTSTKADTVATWIGVEDMGYVNKEDPESEEPVTAGMIEDGEAISLYWNDQKTPEEIRRENNTVLVTGSTRRTNPEKEIQDLTAMITLDQSLMGLYAQHGLRVEPKAMTRRLNGLQRKLLQVVGMPDYKQFEITKDDVIFEPSMLGQDPSAGLQSKMAKQEGVMQGRKEATGEAEAEFEANKKIVVEHLVAQGEDKARAEMMASKSTPEELAEIVQQIEQQQGV